MTIIDEALAVSTPAEPSLEHDWSGSAFEHAVSGVFGEQLVKLYEELRGARVECAEDTVFDWRIDGRRAEVKTVRHRLMRGADFYNVYPHTLDDLYLVVLWPDRASLYHMTAPQAERALGARHRFTLVAAFRAGATLLAEFQVPCR